MHLNIPGPGDTTGRQLRGRRKSSDTGGKVHGNLPAESLRCDVRVCIGKWPGAASSVPPHAQQFSMSASMSLYLPTCFHRTTASLHNPVTHLRTAYYTRKMIAEGRTASMRHCVDSGRYLKDYPLVTDVRQSHGLPDQKQVFSMHAL